MKAQCACLQCHSCLMSSLSVFKGFLELFRTCQEGGSLAPKPKTGNILLLHRKNEQIQAGLTSMTHYTLHKAQGQLIKAVKLTNRVNFIR